jgi:HK97 family phage major capsid protein
MAFEIFNAAQYRALEDAEFEARRSLVIEVMSADELPEGVTDEQMLAERDLILSEVERRNKLAELRNAKLAAVKSEASKVIASSEPVAEKRESEVKMVNEGNFTDTVEYRTALAKHILRQEPMPADYIARARHEQLRAGTTAVAIPGDYTNMVDTLTNTMTSLVAVPTTVSQQIIRELREHGVLYNRVNTTQFPGGVAIPISDLTVEYTWLGSDKVVSQYQEDTDPTTIAFTWHQLEARFSRTFLAEALMADNFKSQLAEAFAEGYGNAMDEAVVRGDGSTQPLGILNDPRLIGTDGLGLDGTGGGKALIIEASQADIEDWTFWAQLLYNPKFNRLYRQRGEWIMGDATWGLYIDTLKDDNNRPIAKFNPLNEDLPMTLRGNAVDTVPNTLIPDFDSAEVGDVFAIFGNLKNYTLNFQPGMPLSTVSWDDHENNAHKTKVLTAVDGRVVDPYGWILLKKKAGA